MSKFINVLDVAIANTIPAAVTTVIPLSSTVPAAGQIIPIVAATNNTTTAPVGSSTLLPVVTDFYLATRDAAGYPRLSLPINVKSIARITEQAYAAATAQVSTVTFAAGDISTGTQITLYIVDKADEEYVNKPRWRYSVVCAAGETPTTLGDKFRALINADMAALVSASGTTTLILTGKADKTRLASSFSFDVIPYQGLSTATTIVRTTSADPGAGNYAIVSDVEEKYKGYKGNMNRSEYVVLPNYQADSTKTYTTFVIEHKRPVDDLTLGATKGVSVETYVFMDSAGAAAFKTQVITALGLTSTIV